jgi:PPOX class probable F420-dependent enzyme
MTRNEALRKLREARVGRLATVRPDGTPHVIPFVFALVEDGNELRVYWAVDDKPKKRADIQRLDNIRANPHVEFVVDGYAEDWAMLWWVRVRGTAVLVDDANERARGRSALLAKYDAYRVSPPNGALVRIDARDVTSWSAAGPSQHSTSC